MSYPVTIDVPRQHILAASEMTVFCVENFGPRSFRATSDFQLELHEGLLRQITDPNSATVAPAWAQLKSLPIRITYKFEREEDAILFKMKFG